MSSMTLRTCSSEKNCSKCDETIQIGDKYHSGPYKSLCLRCFEEDKKQALDTKKVLDDSYIVTGNCQYCEQSAIGVLWNRKVCAAHINQAITESI